MTAQDWPSFSAFPADGREGARESLDYLSGKGLCPRLLPFAEKILTATSCRVTEHRIFLQVIQPDTSSHCWRGGTT